MDRIYGLGAADTLRGLAGNDDCYGGSGADTIRCGFGNDRIDGGFGSDDLFGGLGDDTISAADGQEDQVNCGLGTDTAYVDALDEVDANCEEVFVAQEPQPSDCQVLEPVIEIGDSTNTFTTTTNAFRVNYDGTGFDIVPNSTAKIRIIDNVTQDVVIFVPLDADTADSFIVNAPPGTYELVVDIDPESAESGPTYIVSVEGCGGTTTGTTSTTTGTTTGTTGTTTDTSPT